MKLPLRGAFRDTNNCSRDARSHDCEYQLGVSQHSERDTGQLTDSLGSEREGAREEPGATERAGSAERSANGGGDSQGDEAEHHDRGRHRLLVARWRGEDGQPAELPGSLEGELAKRHPRDGGESEQRQ